VNYFVPGRPTAVGYAPTFLSDVSIAVSACRVLAGSPAEELTQRELLFCIFGPPSRLVVAPDWLAWNGGIVRHLAEAIEERLAFDWLPVLADALADAGCHHEELLRHCRSEGPHVRGCWAVNLILGKE
jgi:hypothetical protein